MCNLYIWRALPVSGSVLLPYYCVLLLECVLYDKVSTRRALPVSGRFSPSGGGARPLRGGCASGYLVTENTF